MCPQNRDGSLGLDPQFLLAGISQPLSLKFPHEKAKSPRSIFQKLSAMMFHFGKSLV